jgi:hypothetical protein
MLENIINAINSVLIIYILSQCFSLLHGWFFYVFLPKINNETHNYYFDYQLAKRSWVKIGLLSLVAITISALPAMLALAFVGIVFITAKLFEFNKLVNRLIMIYTLKREAGLIE